MVQKLNSRDRFIYLFSLFIFAIATFSLLKGWVPFFTKIWWFEALLFVALGMLYSKSLSFSFIKPLYLYCFVLIFNQLSGDFYFNDFVSTITEFLVFSCCMILSLWYMEKTELSQQRCLIVLFWGIVLITGVMSISVYQVEPYIMRTIQFDINGGNIQGLRAFYNKLGLETYEMGHALPSVIPFIIYNFRYCSKSLMKKIMWVTFLIADLVLIYISSATTALLIAFILMFGSLFIGKKQIDIRSVLQLLLLMPIFVVIMYFAASYLLDYWMTSANDESVGKAIELKMFLETGETGDAFEARDERYILTWNAIFSSPIWGVNHGQIGGHQFLLDRVATLGLIGAIPFMVSMWRYMKSVYYIQAKQVKPYLLLSYLAIIIMMISKAIHGFEYWIICLTFVPILATYTSNIEKQYYEK